MFVLFSFGLVEFLLLAAFCVWMVVAVIDDRTRNKTHSKWGALLFAAFFSASWATVQYNTKDGLHFDWSWMSPASLLTFSKYALYYLAAGVVYSVVEFGFEVRRSTKFYSEKWEDFKTRKFNIEGKPYGAEYKTYSEWVQKLNEYKRDLQGEAITTWDTLRFLLQNKLELHCSTAWGNRPIQIRPSTEVFLQPEPYINKPILLQYLGAWVVFWPFYGISLLVGDFLSQCLRWLGSAFAFLFAGPMKRAFRDIFKL